MLYSLLQSREGINLGGIGILANLMDGQDISRLFDVL